MNNFFTFIIISILLVLVILVATYFINIPTNDYEKHSAYECGFEPFGDARSFFDIHFYTIGLLFIIFDLEVVFLIPVVVDIANISAFGYFNLIIFLLVVLIGFYYEWAIGLLNWLPSKVSTTNNIIIGVFIWSSDIIYYADTIYIVLCLLMLVSLLLNQLNNLIYRVINLAGLSILSVAIWVYTTDLTFIYIVYILAFVGAVIMLFLSVILMLPSSVTIGYTKISQNFLLLYVVENSELQQLGGVYFDILIFIILLNILIFLFQHIPYPFKDIYKYITFTKYGIKKCIKSILLISFQDISIKKLLKTFINIYRFFIDLFGLNAPTAIYGAFTKNPLNYKAMPFWSKVGFYWQDFIYYIYVNIESHLYNGISKDMYKYTKPVWGKFFMVIEYGFAPARSIRYALFPIRDILKPYNPPQLRYSLFTFMPYTINVFTLKYFFGNDLYILIINKIIFLINFTIFLITNGIFNILAYLYINDILNIDIIKQTIIIISAFLISTPILFSNLVNNWNNIILTNYYYNIDSLLAIKHILYEENVIYLLVSVISLLIALIGSAVLTRNNK